MNSSILASSLLTRALLPCLLVFGLMGCAKNTQSKGPVAIANPPNANSIVITDELALKMDLDVPGQDLQAMLFPKESRPKDEIEQIIEKQKTQTRRKVALAINKKDPDASPKKVLAMKVPEEPETDVDTLLSCEVLQDPSEDAVVSGVVAKKEKEPAQKSVEKPKISKKKTKKIDDVQTVSVKRYTEVPLKEVKSKRAFGLMPKRNIARHTSLNQTKLFKKKKSKKSTPSFRSTVIP